MSKIKVFNDPLYGLISFPFELIYELIDHPIFQRLRRISQVGLSSLVYPGAVHTRFHHALGVAHLASEAIINLRMKGVEITDEEYKSTCIAALLHDIGHGPFSHALEFEILPIHHEEITSILLSRLNEEFNGQLDLAIDIFNGDYDRGFFKQLLSSQLDVDRMDYLNRDSYYTGVAEGIIGYDRIIKMMNVFEDQLVIEEKAIYSIEKFFMSRYLMYRQVYLHKAAISAERMLKTFFLEYKSEIKSNPPINPTNTLDQIIVKAGDEINTELIDLFILLDDNDLLFALKNCLNHKNKMLAYMANGILNRKLHKTILRNNKFESDFVNSIRQKTERMVKAEYKMYQNLVILGQEKSSFYNDQEEVMILCKSPAALKPFSELSQFQFFNNQDFVNYITFPKEVKEN